MLYIVVIHLLQVDQILLETVWSKASLVMTWYRLQYICAVNSYWQAIARMLPYDKKLSVLRHGAQMFSMPKLLSARCSCHFVQTAALSLSCLLDCESKWSTESSEGCCQSSDQTHSTEKLSDQAYEAVQTAAAATSLGSSAWPAARTLLDWQEREWSSPEYTHDEQIIWGRWSHTWVCIA